MANHVLDRMVYFKLVERGSASLTGQEFQLKIGKSSSDHLVEVCDPQDPFLIYRCILTAAAYDRIRSKQAVSTPFREVPEEIVKFVVNPSADEFLAARIDDASFTLRLCCALRMSTVCQLSLVLPRLSDAELLEHFRPKLKDLLRLKEVSDAKMEAMMEEQKELESKNASLQEQIEKLEGDYECLKTDYMLKEQHVEDLKLLAMEAKEDADEHLRQANNLEDNLAAENARRLAVEEAHVVLREKYNKLKLTLQEVADKGRRNEAEVKVLQGDVYRLEQELAGAEEDLTELEEADSRKARELKHLTQELEAMTDKVADYESRIKALTTENELQKKLIEAATLKPPPGKENAPPPKTTTATTNAYTSRRLCRK